MSTTIFQVGDIVTGLPNNGYRYTTDKVRMRVMEVVENRHMIVLHLNGERKGRTDGVECDRFRLVKSCSQLNAEKQKRIKALIEATGVRLSKAQYYTLMKLPEKDVLLYLNTHLGARNRELTLTRPNRNYDSPWYKARIIEMLDKKRRDLYNPRAEKKPLKGDKREYYGIELECLFPKENFDCDVDCTCGCQCRNECESCGHDIEVDCDGSCYADSCECEPDWVNQWVRILKDAQIKNVQVAHDGSLTSDGDTFGVEFRILTTLDDTSHITALCELIAKYKGYVDTSCGLHVHLDARKFTNEEIAIEDLGGNLLGSLGLLVAMQPKSRRKNQYCQYGMSSKGRYYMINCTSFEKHGTIEVRLHAGTCNATKILNWIKILGYCRNHMLTMANYRQILPVELADYVQERVAKFETAVEPAPLGESPIDSQLPLVAYPALRDAMRYSTELSEVQAA